MHSLAIKGSGIILILMIMVAGVTAAVAFLSFSQQTIVKADPSVEIDTIDFGTIFPGMTVGSSFTVSFTSPLPDSPLDYNLTLDSPESGMNIAEYLLVHKDDSELETETDPQADGQIGDFVAIGTVTDPEDLQDKWLVTLTLPDEITSGDYGCRIKISYPEPEPD
ncbi:MAG: hypothetical protein JW967_04515 [Dehalococcoidales bacterium]|nr:hypothetical protein [Dehalococcoidales bacterium]